jgi:hypothetical protein
MSIFEQMTKEEAIKYCYKNANKFKAEMYKDGENGERQFECLISILTSGSIKPSELPDYGMDFENE